MVEVGAAVAGLSLVVIGVVFVGLGRRVVSGRIAPAMGRHTPQTTTEASWAAMSVIVGRGIWICGGTFIASGFLVVLAPNVGGVLLVAGAVFMLIQTARGAGRLEPRN